MEKKQLLSVDLVEASERPGEAEGPPAGEGGAGPRPAAPAQPQLPNPPQSPSHRGTESESSFVSAASLPPAGSGAAMRAAPFPTSPERGGLELKRTPKRVGLGGSGSRRRDCHSADVPSTPLLKHLLKEAGGAAE